MTASLSRGWQGIPGYVTGLPVSNCTASSLHQNPHRMGLPSFLKRRPPTGAAAAQPSTDTVQQARTRARQRLIGAAVLVIIGIVVFPIVFETRPRPIAVDIPIEIPSRDQAPALAMPAARSPTPPGADAASGPGAASAASAAGNAAGKTAGDAAAHAPGADDVITEPREAKPGAGTSSARTEPAARPQAERRADVAAPKPLEPAHKDKRLSAAEDSARARALLEGKNPDGTAAPGRFVVQVGAFADPASARTVRLKVEKLGLKTYTQRASTSAGERIRVRIGPFETRDDAERALAKAKGAGLNAVVLSL